MKSVTKNLIGRTFGKLRVVARFGTNRSGNAQWLVICDCGNQTVVSGSNLLRSHTISCGCYKKQLMANREKIDIRGQIFGRLTAICSTNERYDGSVIWKCLCSCGKEVYVSAKRLRSKNVLSCGCYHKSRVTTHGLSGTPEYDRARVNRRNEKKRFLDTRWTASMEYALCKLFPRCIICGRIDRLATDHVNPLSRGNGLEPGNAVRLCIRCNSIKGRKPVNELPEDMRMAILLAAQNFMEYWSGLQGGL